MKAVLLCAGSIFKSIENGWMDKWKSGIKVIRCLRTGPVKNSIVRGTGLGFYSKRVPVISSDGLRAEPLAEPVTSE